MVKKVSLLIVVVLALVPTLVFAQSTSTPEPTPTTSPHAGEIKIEGIVESLQNNVLSIGGQSIDVSGAVIEQGVIVGGFAEAFVTISAEGTWVARLVEFDQNDDEEDATKVEIEGVVTEVGVDFVVIGGRSFDISLADVEGNIVVGAFVELELQLSNAGQWVIVEVKLDDDDDDQDDRDDDRGDRDNDDEDNRGPGNSSDDGSDDDHRGSDDDHSGGDHHGEDGSGDD